MLVTNEIVGGIASGLNTPVWTLCIFIWFYLFFFVIWNMLLQRVKKNEWNWMFSLKKCENVGWYMYIRTLRLISSTVNGGHSKWWLLSDSAQTTHKVWPLSFTLFYGQFRNSGLHFFRKVGVERSVYFLLFKALNLGIKTHYCEKYWETGAICFGLELQSLKIPGPIQCWYNKTLYAGIW